jgi:hypothetical protein
VKGQLLSDRELAAVLAQLRKSKGAAARGMRKLVGMYHIVLDAEGYLEAGLLKAFLEEIDHGS